MGKRTSKQALKLPSLLFQNQEMTQLKQKEVAKQHIAKAEKQEMVIKKLLKMKEVN